MSVPLIKALWYGWIGIGMTFLVPREWYKKGLDEKWQSFLEDTGINPENVAMEYSFRRTHILQRSHDVTCAAFVAGAVVSLL